MRFNTIDSCHVAEVLLMQVWFLLWQFFTVRSFWQMFWKFIMNLNHYFLLSFSVLLFLFLSHFLFHFPFLLLFPFLFLQITSELYVPVTLKVMLLHHKSVQSLKPDGWFFQQWSLLTFCFEVDTNVHPTIFPGSFSVRSVHWLDQHIDVLMLVQRQSREEVKSSTGKWNVFYYSSDCRPYDRVKCSAIYFRIYLSFSQLWVRAEILGNFPFISCADTWLICFSMACWCLSKDWLKSVGNQCCYS